MHACGLSDWEAAENSLFPFSVTSPQGNGPKAIKEIAKKHVAEAGTATTLPSMWAGPQPAQPPAAGWDVNRSTECAWKSFAKKNFHHNMLIHQSQSIAEWRTNFWRFYSWGKEKWRNVFKIISRSPWLLEMELLHFASYLLFTLKCKFSSRTKGKIEMEIKPLEITKLKRFCETRQGFFFNYFVSPVFFEPSFRFSAFPGDNVGKTNKKPTLLKSCKLQSAALLMSRVWNHIQVGVTTRPGHPSHQLCPASFRWVINCIWSFGLELAVGDGVSQVFTLLFN